MSEWLLASNFLKPRTIPVLICSEETRNCLKALLLRDGVPEDQVEDFFQLLEAICDKFARIMRLPLGSTLDDREKRRLYRFGIIISNFWYDATGADPIDPDCYVHDRSNKLNCICAYETIFKMVDEMVGCLLPDVGKTSLDAMWSST